MASQRNALDPRNNLSDFILTGPIAEAVLHLREMYAVKNKSFQELSGLSEAALFMVADTIGLQVKLSAPFAIVDGRQLNNKAELIWYIVAYHTET